MKKIFMFAIVILMICSCSPNNIPEELTPVKVQLKWLHQAQFAGIYVARENGIYLERGIELTEIIPYNFQIDSIESVQNEDSLFGVTSAVELMLAKSQGRADDVIAIAVIYEKNPEALYSLKESNITKPQDLASKRVGIDKIDSSSNLLFRTIMKRYNISDFTPIIVGYDYSELLTNTTDAIIGYVTNPPDFARDTGKETNVILLADYGASIYGDILITNKKTLDENPELVTKFLKSTLDGWRYAIEKPEESAGIVQKYSNNSYDKELEMLASSIPLINSGETPIGWMQISEWEYANQALSDYNLIPQKLNLEEVYTNKPMERIYNE
ncbi:MAG: ABC transporter substrate-binding protein [archaeon]